MLLFDTHKPTDLLTFLNFALLWGSVSTAQLNIRRVLIAPTGQNWYYNKQKN